MEITLNVADGLQSILSPYPCLQGLELLSHRVLASEQTPTSFVLMIGLRMGTRLFTDSVGETSELSLAGEENRNSSHLDTSEKTWQSL